MHGNRSAGSDPGVPGVGTGLAAVFALAATVLTGAQAPTGEELPASFEAGLVDLMPVAQSGRTVHFCTDTGGGTMLVRERTARREGWLPNGDGRSVPFPSFRAEASIPAPRAAPDRLRVLPDTAEAPLEQDCDGLLGAPWFAGGTWTLDYPTGRLLHHPAGLPAGMDGSAVALGFQKDSNGARTSHFPTLEVVVDDDSLPMLLDTGARLRPTSRARRALDLTDENPATVATSFVAASVFDRWRRRHPGWRVVPDAGRVHPGLAMIRVPEVQIGGVGVGPVWFTRRPDRALKRWLSRWTDRTVVGALGGSALRHLRITISYPRATAFVREPGG